MSLFDSSLFIDEIRLKRDKVPGFDEYPFSIPTIKNFKKLKLESPVSFFVGENGVGKSTFIEAVAVALGMNAEGGSQNFRFSTHQTTSDLHQYLKFLSYRNPKLRYFLRAESFYNVSTEIRNNLATDGKDIIFLHNTYGGDLHQRSHGESFLQLIQKRFIGNSLYIMDEPESALSPTRQMTLLCEIDRLVKEGCQFLIATHSPILTAYRKGVIYDLDNNFAKIDYFDTNIYQTYKLFLDAPEHFQDMLFEES